MSRYTYSCSLCGQDVVKKPVGEKQGKGKEVAGLGGWRCHSCGPGIKVSRKMN